MAPRFLFLHGFLGQGRDFDSLATELKKKFPHGFFANPDLFSPSEDDLLPLHFQGWTSERLNSWQKQLPFDLKKNLNSPRILIGYSFGGRLALDWFSQHRDSFDCVVLLAAQPGFLEAVEKNERLKNDRVWAEKLNQKPWPEFLQEWNSQAIFKNTQNWPTERFEGDFSKSKLTHALVALSLANMTVTAADLKELSAKTVWVVGARDNKILSKYNSLLAIQSIKNRIIIDEAGHRLFIDQPKSVAEQIVHKVINLL